MELKNVITLEYTKEDRVYRLEMPDKAPLGEAYEATAKFLVKIAEFIQQHTQSVQPKEELEELMVEEEPSQVEAVEEEIPDGS
ncbi:MAG: hypothetical protein Q8O94_03560 [bacterium]|nr:hypothetical protein [bacterium]